jgi:tetratricopeptide (TPR) repeat protein
MLGEANGWGNLGSAHAMMHQYSLAIQAYRRQLEIALDLKERRIQSQALGNMGTILSEIGKFSDAIQNYQESLQIAQSLGDKTTESEILNQIANAYVGLGKIALADILASRRGAGICTLNQIKIVL